MDGMASLSVKGQVSAEEWQARVDCAALYRLVALYGWTDMVFTHISMRVPGPDAHFLINPYGYYFEEMTASALVKVDIDGNVIQAQPGMFINPAGFTIHSAIHAARHDAHCVIHLHTNQGVAVSAQKEGILPLSQHALQVIPRLAHHDYEGVALNLDERERLVADLGDKHLMLLRNHGTLAIGGSAGEAWAGIHWLERTCAMQIMALSAGRDGVLEAPPEAQDVVRGQMSGPTWMMIGGLVWPGLLRKLDRESPGYAD